VIFSWSTTTGLPPTKQVGLLELDPDTLQWVRGPDAVLLRLGWRLAFWRGEWALDLRLGIPYARQFFRRNPSRNLMIQILGDVIRSTPGVSELLSIDVDFDKVKRRASVSFVARLEDDATTIRAVDAPLLLKRY
jgi:hypothetical protein